MHNRVLIIVLVLLLQAVVVQAADMEITPFRTASQRPLVQIFGMPGDSSAGVVPAGHFEFSLVQDVASEYSIGQSAAERIVLDGESYRWTLAARYGVGDRYEVGLDIPYVLYGGGFLDGFIVDWHNTFSLPQGGRDVAPRNRIGYGYTRNGVRKLDMNHSGSGLGDVTLNGGMKLYESVGADSCDRLAIRGGVKFPTGESSALRGSGSTDFWLSMNGSMNNYTEWGSLGLYGSAGVVAMTRGDVLPDQHNNLVGFGSVGLGWGPAEWISFKLQLNGHTPFYHGSSLTELSDNSLMMTIGGGLKLPDGYLLDIGVSEDVAVATAPDVAFHLGLNKRF